jgi:hypothetical protein
MEEKRVHYNRAQLLQWYTELGNTIKNIPRYFIFNMDETGVDDFVDSHDILVAIPRQGSDKKVSIPISRNSKRATLTGFIAADGSALKPLVIMSTGSIIEDIEEAGYTPDKVQFIYQSHGFMTKRIFQYWMQEIFIPYVEMKRQELHYQDVVILLMDQFGGHTYDTFDEDCTTYNIVTRPLIPHTSHLSQPLDQILFSEFKKKFNQIRYSKCLTPASNRLIRILKAWFQTITADLITSTFTAAGIVPAREPKKGFYCCRVDLQRSIHMKNIEPEGTSVPSEPRPTGEAETEDQLETEAAHRSKSAPASPSKRSQKRIPIIKLDLLKEETPEDPSRPPPVPSSIASDSSLVAPPPMKQLNLLDMMKRSQKNSRAVVSFETQTQDDFSSSIPPQ